MSALYTSTAGAAAVRTAAGLHLLLLGHALLGPLVRFAIAGGEEPFVLLLGRLATTAGDEGSQGQPKERNGKIDCAFHCASASL